MFKEEIVSSKSIRKSWKVVNREHKESRKKWREERLLKKVCSKEEKKKEQELKKDFIDDKKNFEAQKISTISIAVPGSILDNAQSHELKAYVSGQIARAACIYQVDEIIVFDDRGEITEIEKKLETDYLQEVRPACLQLARILQYLECPQYLRKYFFPIHKDLQYAGLLNPLDAPHHLRQQDVSLFREGVVSNKPLKTGKGSLINVGLLNDIRVEKILTSGLRVTVKIPVNQENPKKLKGIIVPPTLPRAEIGVYWGYSVKLASSLSEIFSKCPYPEGYDISIGTSDKGESVDNILPKSLKYKHALIVFGGLSGIEEAIEVDPNINVDDASLVFNMYLNTCPQQGSRTIRTEEAILLTLAELRTKLVPEFPILNHSQYFQECKILKSHSEMHNEH